MKFVPSLAHKLSALPPRIRIVDPPADPPVRSTVA